MDTNADRVWTLDQIVSRFAAARDAACEAIREATRGPGNPFGDELESLVWCGSFAEARDRLDWPRFDPEEWEDGTTEDELDAGQWEALAFGQAYRTIGTGRPIAVAVCDGVFSTLFCEIATVEAVDGAVAGFYES